MAKAKSEKRCGIGDVGCYVDKGVKRVKKWMADTNREMHANKVKRAEEAGGLNK